METGDYPYTTRALQQRMMRYEDVPIQPVDTPAIGDEGTPMWFGNMVRGADVTAAVLSLSDALEVEYELLMEKLAPHRKDIEENGGEIILVVNKLDLTGYGRHTSSPSSRP